MPNGTCNPLSSDKQPLLRIPDCDGSGRNEIADQLRVLSSASYVTNIPEELGPGRVKTPIQLPAPVN